MNLSNIAIDVDEATYQAAFSRARQEGKTLDQALAELMAAYAQESGGGSQTYTVQRGDTLSKIARDFYGDARKYPLIQKANNITDPSRIWVGQVLLMPAIAGTAPAPSPPAQPPPAPQPPPPPQPQPAPQLPPYPPPQPPPQPQPVPQPQPPPQPAPAQPTVANYVQAMPGGLRRDRAGGVNVTYQFQIAGEGTWTVAVANSQASVNRGQSPPPSVIISLSGPDFIQLAQGQLNTSQAYQQGRIQVRGDLRLAAAITDLFAPWAAQLGVAPGPTPPPAPQPQPAPAPQPPPAPGGINPRLLNGSFDDYQPFVYEGEAKVWKEPQFPEEYGSHWELVIIKVSKSRFHMMNSGVFGKFTQKYFGGSGLDYHQHGRYSQVVTSRYRFDLALMQTVAAQPGRDYTFSGMIVSFYKGTGGERKDGVIFKTIGIDPSGGRDWNSPNVIWGERDGKDNEWRYPQVKARAQANAITVFIRLENTEKDVGETELNIIHLEKFELQ